jgi:predicted regulator of Ras-like GTPase activity (Roadblock/LC7/MglB family)
MSSRLVLSVRVAIPAAVLALAATGALTSLLAGVQIAHADGNTLTTVDGPNTVGTYNSIAVGADGLPVIAYYDRSEDDLKVAHCGNVSCTAGNIITTVESSGYSGFYPDIAVGADGLPVIAYQRDFPHQLRVAHCGNLACSGGTTFVTVAGGGLNTSIAIGLDGLPVIAYSADTYLAVRHCGNITCSAGSTGVLVGNPGPVRGTTVAIGADGIPIVSFADHSGYDLKVARCGNANCTTASAVTVDSVAAVLSSTSIAIGSDGLPVISYYDSTYSDLKVAHCGNVSCTAGNTLTTIHVAGQVGLENSIAIGSDGLPVISYLDIVHGDLVVGHCGNLGCTSGNTFTTVDGFPLGGVGFGTSITIGADGLPVISYRDLDNGDLKVAHCSNFACSDTKAASTPTPSTTPPPPVGGVSLSVAAEGDRRSPLRWPVAVAAAAVVVSLGTAAVLAARRR